MARPTIIHIGYAGEINARHIDLDISDLRRRWPDAVPQLSVVRPGQSGAYFAERVTMDGDVLTWVFSAFDAEHAGVGSVQIWMADGDELLGMSERIGTRVEQSNGTTGEAGEWQPGFEQRVAQQVAKAELAAGKAADVLEDLQERIDSGEFKGEHGDDGISPTVMIVPIEGGHRVTITDKDGAHSADILDGQGGGASYDDSEVRRLISGLELEKANKDEIPDPYDDSEIRKSVSELEDDLAQKLTQPAGAQVGQFFRVASVDADGHYVLEAVDAPSGGVSDVLVNGASVVEDGVAIVPRAADGVEGTVKLRTAYGITKVNDCLRIAPTPYTSYLNNMHSDYGVRWSDANNLVRWALTDENHITLTAEQQQTAQEVLGLNKEWVLKGTLTTENKASPGVAVDLVGCSEVKIIGTYATNATGTSLRARIGTTGTKIATNVFDGGTGCTVFLKWAQDGTIIVGEKSYYGISTSPTVLEFRPNNITSLVGKNISDISSFYVSDSGNTTECNLQIYAR